MAAMAGVATWSGDKLGPNDHAAPHFMQIRNTLEAVPGLTYRYPMDHADAALRGLLDGRPHSRAVKFAQTTVDNDMANDTALKNGAAANDSQQLQVQPYAMPDVAPQQYQPFANCTLDMLEHYYSRKTKEGATIDTLITNLEGQDYDPAKQQLAAWYDERCREYRSMAGEVSLREFHKMVADLLPDGDHMHSVLLGLARRPESLKETMEDMGSESVAAAKRKLLDTCTKLQKKAKDKGVVGQQWWPEISAGKPAKKKSEVNAVQDAVMDDRLSRLEGTMVAALSAMNVAAVQPAQGMGAGLAGGAGSYHFGANVTTNPFAASSTNPFAPPPYSAVDVLAVGGAAQPGTTADPSSAALQEAMRQLQALQVQNQTMQQQLQQAPQQVANPQQSWGQRQQRGQQQGGMGGSGQTVGSPNYTGCHNCGSMGHQSRNCNVPRQGANGGGGGGNRQGRQRQGNFPRQQQQQMQQQVPQQFGMMPQQ